MKYNILWTETAKKDLHEILEYISYDNIDIAKKQYIKIKENAEKLTSFPEQGRIIPELANENINKYREIIISPWRLMYIIEKNTVFVLAVIDGRRNIEDLLMKRQLRE